MLPYLKTLVALLVGREVNAFKPIIGHGTEKLTVRRMIEPQSVDKAVPLFWTFLAMGNGALGIGIAQVPRLAGKVGTVMELKGQGTSLGGPSLALPVPAQALLYPEALCVADLQAVFNSPFVADIGKVVASGPQDTYLAQKGYLTYAAFAAALPASKYNPLAVKVVFDNLNSCQDAVDPEIAQRRMASWREEGCGPGTSFASDLVASKAKSAVAAVTFAFLIILTGDIIWEEAVMAEMPRKFMSLFAPW